MQEPEWIVVLKVLIGGGILALVGGGAKAWFAAWREDRRARESRQQAIVLALETRVEKLQAKVESLLMDAFARERENNAQMVDRIAMDKQQNEVIVAATAALKEATAALAKRDGP